MHSQSQQPKELHLWTDGGSPVAEPGMIQPFLSSATRDDYILDVGCGDGGLLRLLGQLGFRAKGVDLNADLVALCQRDGLPVELLDAREAIHREADRCTIFLMLDFIEHSPMEMLLEILGAIAKFPGKRIWLQTPNLESLMGFKFWFHMPSHVLPIHPWVLRKLLDKLGYRIVSEWTAYGGLPWKGVRKWLTMKILNALFGAPQAQIFVGGGNICLIAEVKPAPQQTVSL